MPLLGCLHWGTCLLAPAARYLLHSCAGVMLCCRATYTWPAASPYVCAALLAHSPSLTLTWCTDVYFSQVVPDVFTSPASGSIYYCSSPDPVMERALVSASLFALGVQPGPTSAAVWAVFSAPAPTQRWSARW